MEYKSKHGMVSRSPYELFMLFVDMRNFANMLPEDKKSMVQADYDTISATVQGISIGLKVTQRQPYSRLEFADNGAPFHFSIVAHFDPVADPGKTDFSLDISAELNFMMKMMLGGKIQEGLDKVVDSLVAISEGRVPEGINPEDIPGFRH